MKKRILLAGILLCVLLLAACGDRLETPEPGSAAADAGPTAAPDTASPPTSTPIPLAQQAAGLQISELMPANRSYLPDGQGRTRDWIELCNASEHEIALSGLYLSDDAEKPLLYSLPEETLAPGAYLLLFCGGEDGLPFSLKQSGEELLLSGADGSLVQRVAYSETGDNRSLCFLNGEAAALPYATPGYPNSEQGYEDYLQEHDRPGPLVINEIVSFNEDFGPTLGSHGEHFDWIELQNISDESLDLGEYFLSDRENEPEKCRLGQQILSPGERTLIYCSGNSALSSEGESHVDFKLSAGETVWLWHESEGLSDLVYLPLLPGDGSYGRLPGKAGFFFLEQRSPGRENGDGYRLLSSPPGADLPQGIYENVPSLTLRLESPGEIRYTLDGSLPTRQSALYEGPISLEKTTVLRMVAYEEGKHPSPCVTKSYIVNGGHSLPVVSVVCQPGDFQSLLSRLEQGSPSYDASAVLFEGEGAEPCFESSCSIELHGASSRTYPQKSFKLTFRGRDGGDLVCDPFQRGQQQSYHALLLRGRSVNHMYLMKDVLASLAARQAADEPLTLDGRFCVLYLNGNYYGIYALREAYGERYVQNHTGSSPESIQIERNRSLVIQAEVYQYLMQRHLRDDEEYRAFCAMFDVEAFARWVALEGYFSNKDPEGNIRYLRGDGTGGKWTPALFDLDLSLYTKQADFSVLLRESGGVSLILDKLLENGAFRRTLLEEAAGMYHRGLNSEGMRAILEEQIALVDGEMQRNCERWHEGYYLWEQGTQSLWDRLGPERTRSWILGLQQMTGADDETIRSLFGELPEGE